ncbi:LysM peptidoglycan-binding domain-containing protein [Arthrobacter sp. CAN_A1]|uniref:LysM peptidoglycan-binding domain-containing protein n=1 Tax=Arthrobacter sp. CAN_A1 TaxID=2787717 RepID=UPI0018C9AEA9
MNGLRAPSLAVSIALLGILLLVSGQVILAGAGPLTGYQRLEGLLGLCASAAGLAVVGWWLAALVLAFTSEALTRAGWQQAARITAILTPAFMKQLAAAVVGLQLVSGIPVTMAHGLSGHPVTAAARTTHEDIADTANTSTAAPGQDRRMVSPQWKPVPAPADGGPLLPGQHRSAAGASTDTGPGLVVVTPGDSLWTIAAHHLGPFATDVEIAASWPSWYRANRQVIGDDPHLLLPGQLLQVPPTTR